MYAYYLSTERTLRIEILSAGFEDPGGRNSVIKVEGTDYTKDHRGMNIAVLSEKSGEVISTGFFQVFVANESQRMTEYINLIGNGNIVLISAEDEVGEGMTAEAEKAIHALGAKTRLVLKNGYFDVRFRASFVLVAKKGGDKPYWFVEKAADRGKGPSSIQIQIPLCWH